MDLVVDVASVLLGDRRKAEVWRQACRVVIDGVAEATVVSVTDRWPDDLASFCGRRKELAVLGEWARASVTEAVVGVITGMPGVGKSRLAVRAGHMLNQRQAYDVCLVTELRGCDRDRPPADPTAVLNGFLRQLGATGAEISQAQRRTGNTIELLRRLLTGRRTLILLDDAADSDQVRPLLPGVPGCLVLVTSRRELPALPDARHVSLGIFDEREAVELLGRAGGGDRVAADPKTASRIADLLGHLPLALALAGARMSRHSDWTLTDHLERLGERRERLHLDDEIELSVSVSYDGLPAHLRRTFRLLALHPGRDLEPYAAAALTGSGLTSAQQDLAALAEGHLLQREIADRYRFHDLIRIVATARGYDEEPASERRAGMDRLHRYYAYATSLAMDHCVPQEKQRRPPAANPGGPHPSLPDVTTATTWLELECSNLVATAVHAADHDRAAYTAQQSATLARYLVDTARYHDAEVLHFRALRTQNPAVMCREWGNLGNLSDRLGRHQEAIARHQLAVRIAGQIADHDGEARGLGNLGVAYCRLGRWHEAVDHQLRALASYRALGDKSGEGRTLTNLSIAYHGLGSDDEAIEHSQHALRLAQETGDRIMEARTLNNLGCMLHRAGRYQEALRHQREALTLHQASHIRPGQASTLHSIGDTLERLGRLDEARVCQQQALSIARQTGNRNTEAYALGGIGVILRELGQYSNAADYLNRGLEIARDIDEQPIEVRLLNDLGETAHRAGSFHDAVEH